jgi:hypothetical protein
MKKIVCFACLCLSLVACGSEDDYYVCKFEDQKATATMEIYYDHESDKVLKIVVDSEQEITNEELDAFEDSDFDDYWNANASSIEMDGVSVSSKYKKSDQIASMTITINVDNLDKSNRNIFLIPDNLSVKEMIKMVKKENYKCND